MFSSESDAIEYVKVTTEVALQRRYCTMKSSRPVTMSDKYCTISALISIQIRYDCGKPVGCVLVTPVLQRLLVCPQHDQVDEIEG